MTARARAAVLFAALLAALLDVGGLLPRYGLGRFVGAGLSAGLAALLVALAGLWWRVTVGAADAEAPGPSSADPPAPVAPRAVALLPAVAFVLGALCTPPLRALITAPPGLAVALAVLAVLLALPVLGMRPGLLLALVVPVGLAMRAVTFAATELSLGGDMIPLAYQAAGNFLRGRSPYATYHVPWPLPLTYLPGTWLPFALPRAWHFHPRWVNVAAELGLGALLVGAVLRRHGRGPALAHPLLPLWGAVFLLPSSIEWSRISTAPLGWLALALALLAATTDARGQGLALGAAAATTPLSVVFAPFLALTWWCRDGARALLRRLGHAAVVVALVVGPFVAWAPRAFVEGVVLWFNDLDRLPRTLWRQTAPWDEYPGFSGLLWQAGLEAALKPVQALLLAFSLWVYLRAGARRETLPAAVGAGFLLFMVWNPVLWGYFHQPALVAALVGVAVAGPGGRVSERPAGPPSPGSTDSSGSTRSEPRARRPRRWR